jgi:hypothetical protein
VQQGEKFPVSATLYMTFLKCPQQALARLQGMYPEPSKDMFRGLLAHRIFAKHLVDGPIAADEFDLVCRQEAGKHLGGSMASLGMKPSEFRVISANVEELYERFRRLPTGGFAGAEVEVESQPAEGVVLRGRVDAVFIDADGTRIVDWKTGSYLEDAESQLEFYAMTWRSANGVLPVRMEALSLKTGEKRVIVPTDESVAATEEQVADMISALRTAMAALSELARTAGPYCHWCPLLEDCTEGSTALEILA